MLFAVWSLASPWLLLWGAAAVVPIAIHLWSRQRFHETPWAATRFLLSAIRRHKRRMQLEQLLLLALRIAAVMMMALALAEPILSGFAGIGGGPKRPATHTVLVIDVSYSMAYESSGTSRLNRAITQATNRVESALPGDTFSLIALSDPPEAIIGKPSASHSSVLDEIRRLEIRYRGADLTEALRLAEQMLNDATDQFDHQSVHVFSDLGKTTWTTDQEWRSQLEVMSQQQIDLQLTDCRDDLRAENIAIESLTLADGLAHVGTSASINVVVRNFTDRTIRRRRVELLVDGSRANEKSVDIDPDGLATARFSVSFDVAGDHLFQATIGGDGLAVDDSRWLAVSVDDAVRVLCVQGRPHAGEYIALALGPSDPARRIIPELVSERAILERDLNDFECVFLCNVASLTQEEAQVLWQYVDQGGGLVLVLGDLVQSESYNERLGTDSSTPLLPATLKEPVGDRRYGLDPHEYRHPIVQAFRGHERSGLLTAPVWRYMQVGNVIEDAMVAASFDSGDPAIVSTQAGQGRVVLLTTAASPQSVDSTTTAPTSWNSLAAWPSFPPLIHETVRFVSRDQVAEQNVRVGEPLTIRRPKLVAVSSATLTDPNETSIEIQFDRDNRAFVSDATNVPGTYRAAFDEDGALPRIYTANVDTSESDLEAIAESSLSDLFGGSRRVLPTEQTSLERDVPLFRIALGAVLILLLAETCLAHRFGRAGR